LCNILLLKGKVLSSVDHSGGVILFILNRNLILNLNQMIMKKWIKIMMKIKSKRNSLPSLPQIFLCVPWLNVFNFSFEFCSV